MDLWTFNLSRINSLNSRNGFFLALNGEEDKLIVRNVIALAQTHDV